MMRRLASAAVIALMTFVLVGTVPAFAFNRNANETAVLRLINHARVSRGLAAVKVVKPLDRAALSHSRDMLAKDYFAHSSLAGASVAARARGAGYSKSGCSQWSVGEVIALGSSSLGSPNAVFKAWMRSSGHRRVILTKRWRDVGIGCTRGTFKGVSNVVMYTVDFGRRVR